MHTPFVIPWVLGRQTGDDLEIGTLVLLHEPVSPDMGRVGESRLAADPSWLRRVHQEQLVQHHQLVAEQAYLRHLQIILGTQRGSNESYMMCSQARS